MKPKKNFARFVSNRFCSVAIICASVTLMNSCTKYDLDEYLPEGWGSSIYNKLEDEGNYTNTIRLIQDLNQKEVLSKTGSKTLFVADDEAYQRFYANNPWGVKCYEDLSTSQKKLLLYGSMVNNSYQISSLSSIGSTSGSAGIVEGQCVRRVTASTVYDSVAIVKVEDLPNMRPVDLKNNNCWAKFSNRKSVALMKDMTTQPMVHFIEDFLNNNNITNSDIDFLLNNKISRQAGDAVINGVIVEDQNIKCSNGFIHKMKDVILPQSNMADLITGYSKTSEFGKMMDRFAAPYYIGKEATDNYNTYCHPDGKGVVDSVFQKRYFSEQNERANNADDDGKIHQELLRYDPGWNGYYIDKRSGESDNQALTRDMGFILAPSNKALEEYWTTGAGKILIDQYQTVENIPNSVIKELVNNNLQTSFRLKGVESKFGSILNDANDPMDVKSEKVDTVLMGCNGVVYVLNTVYSPTSFVSVKYPTVVNKNMRIMDWAIEKNQYTVYLNSLNAYYSFFIPSNNALLKYLNPASYGKKQQEVYAFHYDETLSNPVWATIYTYDPELKQLGDSIGEQRDQSLLADILKDVLDNCIVVNKKVEDGNEYFITKAGTAIRIKNAQAGKSGMTVEGSYQVNDSQEPLYVTDIYDQSPDATTGKQGNGMCYILEDCPILTTQKSVLDVMAEHEEMYEMYKLIIGCGLYEEERNNQTSPGKMNMSTFNSYNYTVYVPTNEAIQNLYNSKQLPTLEQIEEEREAGETERATADSTKLVNFVRYHFQDNSMFIGSEPKTIEKYETACINSTTGKFERIYVTLTDDNITIQNDLSDSNPVHILKTSGLYNLQAREYFLNTNSVETATKVATSSSAVIHMIDKPLLYK